MIQMNFSHTATTLWILCTLGSSYKDEQYPLCLWQEENHTNNKRTAL